MLNILVSNHWCLVFTVQCSKPEKMQILDFSTHEQNLKFKMLNILVSNHWCLVFTVQCSKPEKMQILDFSTHEQNLKFKMLNMLVAKSSSLRISMKYEKTLFMFNF